MPDNKNNVDDLDYLANLGFEKVQVNDTDLADLNKKIKNRSFSYNNGMFFSFISLIVGVFIGVSVFFMIDTSPLAYTSKTPNKILSDTLIVKRTLPEKIIVLDTVNIIKENFIQTPAVVEHATDNAGSIYYDSVTVIPSKQIDVTGMLDKKMTESKIKYILNAPVAYIHDLKVTNYSLLYFKKNQYVKLPMKTALSVSMANKDDGKKNTSALKQGATYYLHEEFADALLAFKKGNYDQCIYALNVLSGYNGNDINCNFYLGMSYYYRKNYTKAVEFLEKCTTDVNNTFLQEAMFYEAMALYENGEKEKARNKLKVIAEEDGFYAEKAKLFLMK